MCFECRLSKWITHISPLPSQSDLPRDNQNMISQFQHPSLLQAKPWLRGSRSPTDRFVQSWIGIPYTHPQSENGVSKEPKQNPAVTSCTSMWHFYKSFEKYLHLKCNDEVGRTHQRCEVLWNSKPTTNHRILAGQYFSCVPLWIMPQWPCGAGVDITLRDVRYFSQKPSLRHMQADYHFLHVTHVLGVSAFF